MGTSYFCTLQVLYVRLQKGHKFKSYTEITREKFMNNCYVASFCVINKYSK